MTMPRPERQPGKPARSALARLIENWLETAHECSDERISPRSDDAESLFQLAAVYGFLCRTKDRLTSSDEWRSTCDRVDSLARARLADPAMRQRLLDHLGVIGQRLEGEMAEARAEHRARLRAQLAETEHRPMRPRPKLVVGPESDQGLRQIDAVQLAESFDRYLLACAAIAAVAIDAPSTAAEKSVAPIARAQAASTAGEMFDEISGWFFAMERSIDPAYLPSCGLWDLPAEPHANRLLFASGSWISGTVARIRLYRSELARAEAKGRNDRLRTWFAKAGGNEGNAARWLAASGLRAPLQGSDPRAARLWRVMLASATPRLAAARGDAVGAAPLRLEWQAPSGGETATCVISSSQDLRSLTISFFDQAGDPARSLDGQLSTWLGVSTEVREGRARFDLTAIRERTNPLEFAERTAALFIGSDLWRADFKPLVDAPPVPELGDGPDSGDAGRADA